MDTAILKEYKRNRTAQYFTGNNGEPYCHMMQAEYALRMAVHKVDTMRAWDAAGDDVRLRWEMDDCCSIDDLAGDTYDERVNSGIRPSIIRRQRKEFEDLIEREGVWGLIGEYYDGQEWQVVDSVWGNVGQKADGYELDIMSATVKAYNDLEYCPHCGGVISK